MQKGTLGNSSTYRGAGAFIVTCLYKELNVFFQNVLYFNSWKSQGSSHGQVQDFSSSRLDYGLEVPVFGESTWDYNRHRWSKTRSSLCTYEWYISASNTESKSAHLVDQFARQDKNDWQEYIYNYLLIYSNNFRYSTDTDLCLMPTVLLGMLWEFHIPISPSLVMMRAFILFTSMPMDFYAFWD